MEPTTILDLVAPGDAAKLRYSRESGVPVRYLRTITEHYGLQGEPYPTTVTLASGVAESVRDLWYGWPWPVVLTRA